MLRRNRSTDERQCSYSSVGALLRSPGGALRVGSKLTWAPGGVASAITECIFSTDTVCGLEIPYLSMQLCDVVRAVWLCVAISENRSHFGSIIKRISGGL